MGYDLKSTKKFIPVNSITGGITSGDDKIRPFIFTDWVDRVNTTGTTQRSLKEEYNKYVREWSLIKSIAVDHDIKTKDRYISLLKNIALNYTTDEEKRFLTNINYDNPRHVESALTFFSSKIKDITKYYADERENIKYSSNKIKTTGTVKSLNKTIQSELKNILNRLSILQSQVTEIGSDKTVVSIIDLYDTSTVNTDKFKLEYDANLFNDFAEAIQVCMDDCKPQLELTSDLVFSVTDEVEATQQNIELLDYEWFVNYEKKLENLNIYTEAKLITSLIGDDQYVIENGVPVKIADADTPWREIYTTGAPIMNRLSVNAVSPASEISFMNLPHHLGVLTYYSYSPVIKNLSENTNSVGDILKVGNSIYKGSYIQGLDHYEDITWLKADSSNDGLFGDIVNSNNLPRFYSYQSQVEVKKYVTTGISRAIDPTGFFTGDKNLKWANSDVFKQYLENVYPIDERQETLLVGDQNVVRWSTDIYGNEYALLKKIKPPRDPETFAAGESEEDFITETECTIIDGGDTLKSRPLLWTKGVEHKIFEGGRRGGYDPKIEQRLNMTEFEDLRRFVTTLSDEGTPVQSLEPHNAYYYAPNRSHTEMVLTKISFHGFKFDDEQPVYDQQAYCGLFTDETCGRIDPQNRACFIRDNYAFGTFSDILSTIDGNDYYVSSTTPVTSQTDAFEVYVNEGFARFEGDENLLSFSGTTTLTSINAWEAEDMDGATFGTVLCELGDAEYITNESRVSEYYDYRDNVSRTKYAKIPDDEMIKELTLYEAFNIPQGRVVFRSHDSYITDDLVTVLQDTLVKIGTPAYTKYDREIIREQLINNEIVNMDVYNDVIYLQTETHTYVEKVIYDAESRKLSRGSKPSLILKTTTDGNKLETAFQQYYNSDENMLICGHTRITEIDEVEYPQPVIIFVDLNLMTTKSLIIDHEDLLLTDTLSGSKITDIDTPIISYNDKVQIYTLSYSSRLQDLTGKVCHGICIFDFEKTDKGFSVISSNIYHSNLVESYEPTLDDWDEKIISRVIKFPKTTPTPKSSDVSYEVDMERVFGELFSGYTLDLTIDTHSIPVDRNGSKINRIIFDPGDGSPKTYRQRELQTGLEPINFNISDIPDQSDFADPRIVPFQHKYNFEDAEQSQIISTIEVVYANFRKLTITIKINTQAYSIQSAFDNIKLIASNTYIDKLSKAKQILTLEAQNPRTVMDVILTKDQYTNSNVIGYLDGKRYAGPWHEMSDGSLMTGDIHTPASRPIVTI